MENTRQTDTTHRKNRINPESPVRQIVRHLPGIIGIIPFLMVLSTVFVVDTNFHNITVTGKYFWFYIGMGLCSLSTIILFLTHSKTFKPGVLDMCVLILCLLGIGNQLYTDSGYLSTKFVLFLLCCCLFFYFRVLLQQYKWICSVLVLFFLITALIEIVWGLLQLYGYLPSWNYRFRITGSFFNPGPYGGYIAMIAPVAFYYILADWPLLNNKFKRNDWPRHIRLWLSIIIGLGAVVIIPATMSRASWIALLGGCGFVIILFFGPVVRKYILNLWKEQRRKLLVSVFIITTLICVGFSGMYHLKKESADGRKLIWKISMNTLWNHKTGVGLGNFSGYYGESQAAYFHAGHGSEQEKWVAGCPDYAFNEYLQIGVELGILALFVFLFLVFGILYIGIRHKNIAPAGSLFSLLLFASISYPFNVLPFVITLVFLMALCITGRVKKDKKHTSGILFILVVLFPLVGYLLYNRYPTYQAYRDWRMAEKLYRSGIIESAAPIYQKNIPYLKDQVGFLYEYSDVLSALGKKEEAIRILKECAILSCDPIIYHRMGKNYQDMEMYKEAEVVYRKAADIIPNRIYPYYLLAKLYIETGEVDKAKKMAGIVVNKVPKVDSQIAREMIKEMEIYLKTDKITK